MKNYICRGVSLVLLALLAVAGGASQEPQEPQEKPPEEQPEEQQEEQQKSPWLPLAPAEPTAAEQAAIQKIFQTTSPQERLALVEEFLAQYPESLLRGRAYAAAAQAHAAQNNLAKAVEYGERALEVDPREAFTMILVANWLAEGAVPTTPDYQDKLARGEDYARQALEILPELFAANPRRPEVPEEQYKLQQQYAEALAHAALGFIHLRRNENDQAEQELKQAIELNQLRPDSVDFERLGFAHVRQQKYAEAEAAFQRCVELGGPASSTCQKRLEYVRGILKEQQTQKEQPTLKKQETPKETNPQERSKPMARTGRGGAWSAPWG